MSGNDVAFLNALTNINHNLQKISKHLRVISEQQKESNELLTSIDTNLQTMDHIKESKD